MAEPLRSGSDASKLVPSATSVLRAPPGKVGFETDFAHLAACLSAQTGGGLSPELSNELALEIVLNEVVEQACLTTGATGAAIALERDGEMICRGCSGVSAPRLGSRIDITSGIAGECVRARHIQRSDDILSDPRVDHKSLNVDGVRSLVMMPLIRNDKLLGLFELLSSISQAFGERDERTLEALAFRVFENLERAAQPPLPPPPLPEPPPIPGLTEEVASASPALEAPGIHGTIPESSNPDATPTSSSSEFDVVTWSLRAAIVVCLIVLGLLLGRHVVAPDAKVRPRPVAPPAVAHAPVTSVSTQMPGDTAAANSQPVQASTAQKQENTAQNSPAPRQRTSEKGPPPGGLQIFENGKEIFRMPPQGEANASVESETPAKAVQRASSSEPEKPEDISSNSGGTLVRRVEPEYPANALTQKIEGAVVLDVQINRNGVVQDVQVVSGPPELAASSIAAVKQWQFQPRLVNGRRTPMQTQVTLNYKLPQ